MRDQIDWLRWLFYLLGGIPLVFLVFFVRDRVLRLVTVIFVTIFVQDSFVGRRYFGGLSLAPSLVVAYIGLLSQVLARRRLPATGIYGPLWIAFLFAGIGGVISGSLGTGLLQANLKEYQISYVEGVVFFLYGITALREPEELRRFFRWMVVISAGLAFQHFFVAATGYHFRGSSESVTSDVYYSGVLDNGNSLGSYWALGIPVTLGVALSPSTPRQMRTLSYAVLVPMLGSLILTGSRGGFLFTVVGCGLLVFTSGARVGKLLSVGFVGLVFGALGYLVITTFLSTSAREVFDIMKQEGLETNRFDIFRAYASMLAQQPLGVGMAADNVRGGAYRHGILAVSAHNIYLDIGVQTGVIGLACFLGMAGSFLLRNRRAARLAGDAVTREGLGYLFLCLMGFLGVGLVEPIYSVSSKLNNVWWLLAGLSVGAANWVFDAGRSARTEEAGPGGVPTSSLSAHAPHA